MAEAPDKSLEELEKEITCAVCYGHYEDAKLLPCVHYYCRACIEAMAKRSRGRPFPCPECRKATTLPPGGAKQLKSAFFVERIKDVYEKMAKVYATPEFELGDLPSVQLGQPCQATLKSSHHGNFTIRAELKSLVNPALSVQADVIPKEVSLGIYNITCTPRVRGRHDLMVKVDGKDIVGSPFRVFVKIHPTQLGPPVRTITGVQEPWGIAINNNQQLIVVGEKKVTIMERDGKRVQTIECEKFQVPRGVATGPDGAIYVTDWGAHCLFKFNKEGRLLKTVHELKRPLFSKIIRNHLYVSNCDNFVKIFDTNCNVIGTLSTNECSCTYDIAGGDNGLYVVGNDKIGVYSCAPNGGFKHRLTIQPSSVKLSTPQGICFDRNGHLFVSQAGPGNEGVYVFTPSGKHVTSFGQASSGVSMTYPAGIAIDEDGFVYVCSFWSPYKVVVF